MITKIILIILVCVYTAFNLLTAKLMNAKEMRGEFIDGQCAVGRVFANIFYAPAWILKGLRFVVVGLIK